MSAVSGDRPRESEQAEGRWLVTELTETTATLPCPGSGQPGKRWGWTYGLCSQCGFIFRGPKGEPVPIFPPPIVPEHVPVRRAIV